MDLRSQMAADLPMVSATPMRSEEGRETIMGALDVFTRGDSQQLQEPMRAALAELWQWSQRRCLGPWPHP